MQIATTFLESRDGSPRGPFQLDIGLDELDSPIGAGADGLRGCAGKPVDHRAAGNQSEQEQRIERRKIGNQSRIQVPEWVGSVKAHDDGKDHRRRADNGRTDQHRLRRGLERIAGPVVLLEMLLGLFELRIETEVLLDVR